MSVAEKTAKKSGGLGETVNVIFQALILALVIRTLLFQPFSIPSGSMRPTLLEGDYLFVTKWAYGYSRYSLPFSPNLFSGRIFGSAPERGDVVVFKFPPNPSLDYIKRVIGLPGDRIQMREGRLYINDVMAEREEIGRKLDTDSNGDTREVTVYRETFPEGTTHIIQEIGDNLSLDNTPEYQVPAGHYFMMGDNRDRSADSRVLSQVGYVPAVNLIAKAEARFFSIRDNLPPWQIWQWPANVRWDRMFQSVYGDTPYDTEAP